MLNSFILIIGVIIIFMMMVSGYIMMRPKNKYYKKKIFNINWPMVFVLYTVLAIALAFIDYFHIDF